MKPYNKRTIQAALLLILLVTFFTQLGISAPLVIIGLLIVIIGVVIQRRRAGQNSGLKLGRFVYFDKGTSLWFIGGVVYGIVPGTAILRAFADATNSSLNPRYASGLNGIDLYSFVSPMVISILIGALVFPGIGSLVGQSLRFKWWHGFTIALSAHFVISLGALLYLYR